MKCQKKKLLRDYLEGYDAETIQIIKVKRSVSRHTDLVKLCFHMKSISNGIPVPGSNVYGIC